MFNALSSEVVRREPLGLAVDDDDDDDNDEAVVDTNSLALVIF